MGYLICLRYKAMLHLQGEYKDIQLASKYLMEAITYRRPDFKAENIQDYFLSLEEFMLINNLALLVNETEGLPKALEMWQKLKTCYEKTHSHSLARNAYRDLVMNISIALKLLGRYEECLEAAIEGCERSLYSQNMKEYSRYLYQRAFCLMKLDRRDEGRPLYRKFLMLACALDGQYNISFETVSKEYEDEFGEPAPFTPQAE